MQKEIFKYDPNAKRGNCFTDKTGKRFGRLLVLGIYGYHKLKDNKKKLIYECLCDCGSTAFIRSNDLVTRRQVSCGCYKAEQTVIFNTKTKGKILACTRSSVWQSYKKGAKDRGLEWQLEKNTFFEMTQQNCFYCDKNPEMARKARNGKLSDFIYNGLDRVDPSKGYTLENVVSCCKNCNRMKRDLTLSEFKEHIFSIANHLGKGLPNETLTRIHPVA